MSARSIGIAVVWESVIPTGTLMVMLNRVSPWKAATGLSTEPSWIGPVIELALSRGTAAVVLLVIFEVPCTMRMSSNSEAESHDPISFRPAEKRLSSWASSRAPTPLVADRLTRALSVSSP